MAFPTKKQQEILDILDKNIVVSASAGSGKTSIMIERIANFISNFQVPIKEMLVVTFTNSAAAEMKERLVNKLAQKIEEEKDYSKKAFLISQAEDIDSANICTIDKFCISILQKYYYLLGLDGNFNIIEDIENEKLKNRAFDNAIKKLRKENPILIDELCDAFLEHRQTTKLKELADKILFYLSVQEDRVEYLQKTLFCLYTLPIEKNSIYANAIAKVADVVERNSHTFERYIDLNIEHEKTANLLQLYKKFFNDFKNAKLNEKHAIISSFAVIKLGNKKAENPDEIKNSIYEIENTLNEYKDIFNPQFTLKELEEQLKNSKSLIEKLMQFVTLYEKNLLDYKKENNSFTFADIEYFAYEILKKDEVKNTLTDEISLIFVDEYQDVNKLQEHLISQIAKKNNLFLVGDIKQSIYGFRLSDPRFFEQKLIEYASKENIYSEQKNLNENFRSDKDILDFVNLIFKKCMTAEKSGVDYANTSLLVGSTKFENNYHYPKICVDIGQESEEDDNTLTEVYSVKNHDTSKKQTKNIELEAEIIVQNVLNYAKTKIQNKDGVYEQVEFKDIAILFRSKKALYRRVGELLKENNIPVNMSFKDDIYNSVETRFLCNFLFVIQNLYDDIAFASILSFPCMQISDIDLLKISEISNEKNFIQKCITYSKEKDDELGIKLKDLFAFIQELKIYSLSNSVYNIFCKIIQKYDLENWLYALPNGRTYIGNLKRVLSSVSANNGQNLIEYVNFLKNKSSINKDISVGGEENSVNLMTIHASKGLEFKVVILASTLSNLKTTNNDTILLTEKGAGADFLDVENKTKSFTFVKKFLRSQIKVKSFEEEKRLLYVALTRAKNILIVTGLDTKGFLKKDNLLKEDTYNYMSLVLLALQKDELEKLKQDGIYEKKDINARFRIIKETNLMQEEKDIVIFGKSDKNLSKYFLDYFNHKYAFNDAINISAKSSVSSLLKDDEAYVSFNLQPKKLELDEHMVSTTEIGSAYHKCFELIDFSKNVELTDVEKVVEQVKFLGFDTDNIDKQKIFEGCVKLGKIIQKNAHIKKEQPFIMNVPYDSVCDSIVHDEVLVQGVIDLLIIDETSVKIVDYKNTKIRDNKKLIDIYKKQLELYAMATKYSLDVQKIEAYLYNIQTSELLKVF